MSSETEIIQKLKKQILPYGQDVIVGIGDDAAVLLGRTGEYLLATTDVQVEGVHFVQKKQSPQAIGKKAAIAAISDIAAMGGRPAYVLASLIVAKNYELRIKNNEEKLFIEEMYKGFTSVFKKYDIDIVGGNISSGRELSITLTIIGYAKPGKVVLRNGARVGDLVLLTGKLGDRPVARVSEGVAIGKSKLATAMIDVSDGLSTDLLRICEQSSAGVALFADSIPRISSLKEALHRGEDYELCFTASPKNAEKLMGEIRRKTGTKVSIIGEVITKKEGRWIMDDSGRKRPLTSGGWDHFTKNPKHEVRNPKQ